VNDDVLLAGLGALGLADRTDLVEGLGAYRAEVETWNERLGLVSLKGPDDLAVKHLLDSLAPWKILAGFGFSSLADLGSGAGFPGIPLALAFPSARTVLVERMERRAGFLESTLLALGRTDVTVLQRTFEEVKDQFDLVTFRAFTPLEPKVVKKMKRILAPGGRIAAYKGRREVIDAELATLGALADGAEVLPLTVPFLDEERHLVILRG
jgi:16S rRNA (guanine527-N7)-methyltransferase